MASEVEPWMAEAASVIGSLLMCGPEDKARLAAIIARHAPPAPAAGEDAEVLIWSNEHHAWWAPGSRGYTSHRSEAGMFARAEAEIIVAEANKMLRDTTEPYECIVPVLKSDHARRAAGAAP